jgi:iron complex outermembrane receptor protein
MDILRGSWSLALDHQFDRTSGSMRLYRNFGTHDLSNGFHSTDFNNGLILSESFRPVRNLLLQIGLDGNQYGGKAVATPPGVVLTDTSLMELGVNGFAQYVLAEKWTLNGGLRLQYNSQYGKEYLPTAGLAWDLGRGSTWKVSLGKGFRSPTLRELFLFNHNPALLPERVWNYETSLIQELPVGKTRLELTAFYLQGSNLILTGPMGRLYNGGGIENKGLELAASCEPMPGLQLRGTLSYIDMATPVYATPRTHAFVQGMYRLGKARFHTDVRWVEHLNTAVVGQSFQTYLLWNAGFQYNLLSNLEFNLSGNNLLNRTYETIRYYTMPGINGSAGLSYRF